ncbi:hypothetical protein [Amphritea sp.]|uniref:hypothetical protein n=1 Tax=Amphritea sp. TaxID=1872502 RepID=UPI0025C53222|nr:hypothetical protein [Amphritea sp.]
MKKLSLVSLLFSIVLASGCACSGKQFPDSKSCSSQQFPTPELSSFSYKTAQIIAE